MDVIPAFVNELIVKLFGPVCDEIGDDLKNGYINLKNWRSQNLERIVYNSAERFDYSSLSFGKNHKAAVKFIEFASLEDNEDVQKLWEGILCSSCKVSDLESSTIYIEILASITAFQARILNYVWDNLSIQYTDEGLSWKSIIKISLSNLIKDNEVIHIDHIVSQITHLDSLGLLTMNIKGNNGRIDSENKHLYFGPSSFCIDFLLRINGFNTIDEYLLSKQPTTHPAHQ